MIPGLRPRASAPKEGEARRPTSALPSETCSNHFPGIGVRCVQKGMTVPGCFTATLALSIWLGALALGQRVDRTLVELDAVGLSTPELTVECARLQTKIDLVPSLRKGLDENEATLARWLKVLPAPEIATPERLLERVQECCEEAQFQLKSGGFKPAREPPYQRVGDFEEIDITFPGEGTPTQFLEFLSALERSVSFVRVNSFRCVGVERLSHDRRREGRVTVALNISTFRLARGIR